MMSSLVAAASSVGLHANFSKTEVLSLTSSPTPSPPLPSFPLINECGEFKYLGSLMSDSNKAFEERRRLAWASTRSLYPIFTSTVSEIVKVRLFQAMMESILFYGCESWVFSKTLQQSIDASHRALLRAALNIRWPQMIRNEELYARSGAKTGSWIMRQKRLVLFGKAVRGEPSQYPISRVLRHQPL